MKTIIKTDDRSFKKFLYALSHDCIVEHARKNLLSARIAHVIMENQYLQKDSFEILTNSEIKAPAFLIKEFLKPLLEKQDGAAITELMVALFSKKLMVDTLLKYADEYARLAIIEHQNAWNQPNTSRINYN